LLNISLIRKDLDFFDSMGKNIFRSAEIFGDQKEEEPIAKIKSPYHKIQIKVNWVLGMNKRIPSLIMVGTVHRDPRGYGKLSQLLKREQPALISVEVSPYARTFRAWQSAAWRATLRENLQRIKGEVGRPLREIISQSSILGIFILLKEPYEWQAAKSYADRHGTPLRDVDLSSHSHDKLARLSELISMENLRTLLRIPFPDLRKQVESQYSRARSLFLHPPSTWPTIQGAAEREAYMAEKIRRFVQRGKGKKILHIGGWEHMVEFSQGNSLYGLLKDLGPQRILLSSAAN
jgi:pheromone shutdown protein TraB